jgi:hypothetical protein
MGAGVAFLALTLILALVDCIIMGLRHRSRRLVGEDTLVFLNCNLASFLLAHCVLRIHGMYVA